MRSQFARGCTTAAAALMLALPLMARAEQAPVGTTSKLVKNDMRRARTRSWDGAAIPRIGGNADDDR